MAAPVGNQFAKKAKIWEQAIKRALARMSNQNVDTGLDKLADKLVAIAAQGDSWALKEIGDRIDGKAVQQVELDAEFRQRDISAEPLDAAGWERQYGVGMAAAVGTTKEPH